MPIIRQLLCSVRRILVIAAPWRRYAGDTPVERHFTSGDTARDIVIGMSDDLTVPFALAAGLSGAR